MKALLDEQLSPQLAESIAGILRDNPDGLASSERWISPLPGA